MKDAIKNLIKFLFRLLPDGAPEFIYTTVLKPKPLKIAANKILTLLIPETLLVGNSLIALNKNDPVVSGALMLGAYEKFETPLIRKSIKQGGGNR